MTLVNNYLKKVGVPENKIEILASAENITLMLNVNRIDIWSYETKVAFWLLKKYGFNPSNYTIVYTLQKGELYYAVQKDTDHVR